MRKLEIPFSAPVGVEKQGAFIGSQLEDRLACGFQPTILLGGIKNPYTLVALHSFLVKHSNEKGKRLNVDFVANLLDPREGQGEPTDIGLEDSLRKLQLVEYFRDLGDEISVGSLDLRPSSIRPVGEINGLNCKFGTEEYADFFDKTVDRITRVANDAERKGLRVSTQNYHKSSFNFFRTPKEELRMREPRYNGNFDDMPNQVGLILSNTQELNLFFEMSPNVNLNLDLEHLSQTAEYGFVFHLDKPFTPQVKKVKDLTLPELSILRHVYAQDDNPERILFDYSYLRKRDIDFLDKFGFIVREGQPIVFNSKRTYTRELESLSHDIEIESVEPGRQVNMFYTDIEDGERVRKIGSHLSAYLPKYVKDSALRTSLTKQSDEILTYALNKINNKFGLKGISTAYQIGDENGTIYEGPMWREEALIAKKELEKILERALCENKEGSIPKTGVMHFDDHN